MINIELYRKLDTDSQVQIVSSLQALLHEVPMIVGKLSISDSGTIDCDPVSNASWSKGTCLVFESSPNDVSSTSKVLPIDLLVSVIPNIGGITRTPEGWHIPHTFTVHRTELLEMLIVLEN